jgi:hypothetical protein
MREGRISRVLLASSASALALAAASAATTPPPAGLVQKHTKADTTAAQGASLTLGDLGLGWTTGATGGAEPALTCPSHHPNLTGIVETGAASSDTFQAGSQGPFASSSAWVYKTPTQAGKLWQLVVGPKLLGCLASSVAAASTKDVKFTVRSKNVIHAPSDTKKRATYRVVATATTAGSSSTAYYDLVVVGAGRGVAELTFARIGAPMSASTEAKLAGAVARRLAAIPAK